MTLDQEIQHWRAECDRLDKQTLWQSFRTWPAYAQFIWWLWTLSHAALSIWAAYELVYS